MSVGGGAGSGNERLGLEGGEQLTRVAHVEESGAVGVDEHLEVVDDLLADLLEVELGGDVLDELDEHVHVVLLLLLHLELVGERGAAKVLGHLDLGLDERLQLIQILRRLVRAKAAAAVLLHEVLTPSATAATCCYHRRPCCCCCCCCCHCSRVTVIAAAGAIYRRIVVVVVRVRVRAGA